MSSTIQLDIQGMTCASCAARIEKKLNKVGGVTATVNYSTEKATVEAPPGTTVDDLISVVEKAGYGATIPEPEVPKVDEAALLLPRVIWAFALGVPVVWAAVPRPAPLPPAPRRRRHRVREPARPGTGQAVPAGPHQPPAGAGLASGARDPGSNQLGTQW